MVDAAPMIEVRVCFSAAVRSSELSLSYNHLARTGAAASEPAAAASEPAVVASLPPAEATAAANMPCAKTWAVSCPALSWPFSLSAARPLKYWPIWLATAGEAAAATCPARPSVQSWGQIKKLEIQWLMTALSI